MLAAAVHDVLGLSLPSKDVDSPFVLMERIEAGLPVAALDRLARLLAPDDPLFKYRLVAKATYERRKARHRLSPEEGARLTRLARVWALALEVWQDQAAARDFLFRPHSMIQDQAPIDMVIRSELGSELVLDILNRLKYGTAA